MKNAITVNGMNDRRLAPYRSLKVRHPETDGVFIVESKPAVRSLLKREFDIISCLTTRQVYDTFGREFPGLMNSQIPVLIMGKSDIERIIGFRFHQGIMAAVRSPKRHKTEERIACWNSPHLLLATNGVHDPQNVGLIVRNAAAFGADTLIVDQGTYEPFYRKVVRISMGSIFNLPIAYETDLYPVLKMLKTRFKTRIIVTSPSSSGIGLGDADLSGNICLVMGNEVRGVSRHLADIADMTVKIPLFFERADSLNVACASAVFLYKASTHRIDAPGSAHTSICRGSAD